MDKKSLFVSSIAIVVFLLDQLTKLVIKNFMALGDSVAVLPTVFHITFIQNKGAGFGILQGQRWLLVWVAVMVIGVILFLWDKIPNKKYSQWGVGLILGGTIGNLIDRIAYGAVIDFIDFRIWPAFNVADSALSIGALLLIIYLIRRDRNIFGIK